MWIPIVKNVDTDAVRDMDTDTCEVTALGDHVLVRTEETRILAAPIFVLAGLARELAGIACFTQAPRDLGVATVTHTRALVGNVCGVADLAEVTLASLDLEPISKTRHIVKVSGYTRKHISKAYRC